ncbi:S-adenosylhomocysteine deaminase [Methanosalsum zhilinae DSM 4017]|uniref:S-adenosylhomocysteine deaminase n=1 Tax=Methanosalsum zhilinae (strain DSM 4017 / NBRC 107636 / OCM 62 / WeN5) TaxID=679901 RepID=F7XNB0_METZD|nr:amidohydrolase family protein [Methanosalsum zhilinae]AEH60070.1 S-adenosylhomocysteine deaminase [Methanosalsum zhilinae DSM 4017]
MSSEKIVPGRILYGPDFEVIEGYITIKDGIISKVTEEKVDSQNIITPCFVNCHTHIADSVYKDPPLGEYDRFILQHDLDSLVKPPDGLKHRVLQKTSTQELIEGMRYSLKDMLATGTSSFADFRENGLPGVLALKDALKSTDIDHTILGRPSGYVGGTDKTIMEVERILEHADGMGISGINDMNHELIEAIAECTKEHKKIFAIHCAEKERKGIDTTLGLQPNFLIHMTRALKEDLETVADLDIPVIVCPRSNFTTGAGMAPVAQMLEMGIKVGIGTDNVMLNSVNMFAEMEILSKVFGLEDRQVFKMCTINGASILGQGRTGMIQENCRADIMILNGYSNNLSGTADVLNSVVRRARPDDILAVIDSNSCKN